MSPRLLPAIFFAAAALAAGLILSSKPARGDGAAEAPAPRIPGRTITASDLPTLLEGLGYEVSAASGTSLQARLSRDGWNFALNADLSPDGSTLWFHAPLRQLKDRSQWTSRAALALLQASSDVGPARFYFVPSGNWVGVSVGVDNRDVRPMHVRQAIDDLCTAIREKVGLWEPDRWGAVPTPPTPAPAAPIPTPAMAGAEGR